MTFLILALIIFPVPSEAFFSCLPCPVLLAAALRRPAQAGKFSEPCAKPAVSFSGPQEVLGLTQGVSKAGAAGQGFCLVGPGGGLPLAMAGWGKLHGGSRLDRSHTSCCNTYADSDSFIDFRHRQRIVAGELAVHAPVVVLTTYVADSQHCWCPWSTILCRLSELLRGRCGIERKPSFDTRGRYPVQAFQLPVG